MIAFKKSSEDDEFVPDTDPDMQHGGDIDAVDVEEFSSDKIKKLRQDLKKCMDERGEYLAGWQRAKADFVNRERDQRELGERMGRASRERILEDLLPVLDGFQMAISSPAWQHIDTSWRSGMEALATQLQSVLQKNGIEAFDPTGEPFDPMLHEAVGTKKTEEARDDHMVAVVLQKGYRMEGRVVRPARVQIWEHHGPV